MILYREYSAVLNLKKLALLIEEVFMDKNAIKKFAVWARRELISRVRQKAQQYGISETEIVDANADSVNGRLLSEDEKDQRVGVIGRILESSYTHVMEEVAYTWFNRFIALRFMEVNGYLPTHVRVFTDDENAFKPQILSEAIHLDLDGLNMDRVYALKDAEKTEELYKYLLITQCNALSDILPGMFQEIADYTELLFPDNLLREGSVIEQMIAMIPQDDWRDAVQIIGWLYQYYNTEPKDKVFADLKKNIKINRESIPAATQLFTPDWIVRYMVENSLGRLWLEYGPSGMSCGNGNDALRELWQYYLDEADQEPEVERQLQKLRAQNNISDPSQIRCIDPCMGSGHILAYMFDVLMQIYLSFGYNQRDAAKSIVENNLYGLDIDERAAQLAYFAVMMKARQYDRRFFTRGVQPHVRAVGDSLHLDDDLLRHFGEAKGTAKKLKAAFAEAKEHGSLLHVDVTAELRALRHQMLKMHAVTAGMNLMDLSESMVAIDIISPLVDVAEILIQKYDVVVTNPPYMGSSGMGAKLGEYVKKNYPDSKSDLFAVFIERCGEMTKQNGYQAMITQHAWMFLSSFEKLRGKLQKVDMINMAHLGARAFEEIGGEVVQTTSFVLRNSHVKDYKGTYCRLIEPTTQQGKEDMFLAGTNRYIAQQDNFAKIPGSPVAYWLSDSFSGLFRGVLMKDYARLCKGLDTADNIRFVRMWHEVGYEKFAFPALNGQKSWQMKKWIPFNNGGEFRRWYGDNCDAINWENEGYEVKHGRGTIRNPEFYFKEGVTWTDISSGKIGVRYFPAGFIFSTVGLSGFHNHSQAILAAILNCCVSGAILKVLSPTMHFNIGDLNKLPICLGTMENIIEKISSDCISLSRADWDSFETSWDFQRHPLTSIAFSVGHWNSDRVKVEECFKQWTDMCEERFQQLKVNEEELNRIFIDNYGLQNELTPDVADKDVTVRRADLKRDIRSLISYAVGCMFGRYSLDAPGLILAGQPFDSRFGYKVAPVTGSGPLDSVTLGMCVKMSNGTVVDCSFEPDKDNVLPICDDEYFEDDIVGRFVRFIEVVFGKESLEENLRFIADALGGGSGSPRDVIRSYFLNDFYADHLKIYQKRPIYWLFDSGKKNGFKALIYMHRYQPDTIARIRTDYLHEQQARYCTAIEDLTQRVAGASASERIKLSKQLAKLQAQAQEAREFEEKIHHLADRMVRIDLDDGVKHNYALFGDVLASVK